MIDILTETLSIERHNGGSWVEGRYIKSELENLSIKASVQPLRPNEVKILPEHRRTAESVKIYSDTKLKTSDELNGSPADVIVHDGKRFEVHSVANWSIGTDIPHYKIIAVKQDGQGGGQ